MFRGLVAAMVMLVSVVSVNAQLVQREGDVNRYRTQPMAHFSGAAISYTENIWVCVDQAGVARKAMGFSVDDTSSGGNLVIRLVNDYKQTGAVALCTLKVAASSGSFQTIGVVFDRIYSAGTTLKLGGLTVWY